MAATANKKTQRQRLLAMAHIAPKELGISDEDVRGILQREFGKESRADLTELELGYLVDYFVEHGWQARGRRPEAGGNKQIVTLRARALEIAEGIENGDRRLRGLVRKICGVDRPEWASDAAKMKQVLAVMERIKKEG